MRRGGKAVAIALLRVATSTERQGEGEDPDYRESRTVAFYHLRISLLYEPDNGTALFHERPAGQAFLLHRSIARTAGGTMGRSGRLSLCVSVRPAVTRGNPAGSPSLG